MRRTGLNQILNMCCIIKIKIERSFEGVSIFRLESEYGKNAETKYSLIVDETGFTGYGGPSLPRREPLDRATVEGLLAELEATPVNICPPEIMGLDGTTTTIEIHRGANKVSFTWWSDLPKQWKNLHKIIQFITKY